MATSIEEIETQTEDTAEDTNGTSKRQRVDIEKLAAENPNEKITLAFQVPAGMRLELKKLAETAGVTEAQYVRDMVAEKIGYDVPEEFNERKRRSGVYAGMTEEEKKAVIAQQAAEKRANVNKLLMAIASGAVPQDVLDSLGIDVDDLPKPKKQEATATA